MVAVVEERVETVGALTFWVFVAFRACCDRQKNAGSVGSWVRLQRCASGYGLLEVVVSFEGSFGLRWKMASGG